ncbi:hypothetical protein HN51_017493 [Arachis hypogaea]
MIRVFDINKILLSKWVLFAKFYCTIEPVQEITDATRMVCKTMMSCPPVALDTALNQTECPPEFWECRYVGVSVLRVGREAAKLLTRHQGISLND